MVRLLRNEDYRRLAVEASDALNAAYGGSWGGQKGTDDSILPQKYFIDYVRVYKAK